MATVDFPIGAQISDGQEGSWFVSHNVRCSYEGEHTLPQEQTLLKLVPVINLKDDN